MQPWWALPLLWIWRAFASPLPQSPSIFPIAGLRDQHFPSALIIGVKKAGTRALLEFLRLNPQVKAPGPEVHFFDRNFHRGFQWYRKQMPPTAPHEVTVEKTPAYFISKEAPERIKNFNPAMKLIIVLRDPVIRAISDYTQSATKKRRVGQMPSFEKMAVGYTKKACGGVNCSEEVSTVNSHWSAVRIGVYHKYVERWLKHFPLHQIHFVDGENLIRSPAVEVARVETFLGLPSVVRPENFAIDPVKKFPCVKKEDGSLHCLGKSKGRKHPRIKEPVLKRLKRYYRLENEELFKMINRTFQWNQ